MNTQNPPVPLRASAIRPIRTAFTLVGFYQANEAKAENLGAAVSRLFLGVKLECAQCHDHPFAPYTREQFWEFAAFFAELEPAAGQPRRASSGPIQPQADKNRLTIPNTEQDGGRPLLRRHRPRLDRRNRIAAPGTGRLADQPEEPVLRQEPGQPDVGALLRLRHSRPGRRAGREQPAQPPELLEELGQAFADAKFDNRVLMRGIIRSQAYQLSSKMTHPSQADARRFARMNIKGLTPGQLFDSMVAATGHREPALHAAEPVQLQPTAEQPAQPVPRTASPSNEKLTEANTTILQALMLMNGQFITDVTSLEKGEVLGAIVDVPGWDTQPARHRAVPDHASPATRLPRNWRSSPATSIAAARPATRRSALADVFWVLLNSPEFLFNH